MMMHTVTGKIRKHGVLQPSVPTTHLKDLFPSYLIPRQYVNLNYQRINDSFLHQPLFSKDNTRKKLDYVTGKPECAIV